MMLGRRLRCPARVHCWRARLGEATFGAIGVGWGYAPLCPACELVELGQKTVKAARWKLGELVGSYDLFRWRDLHPEIVFARMHASGWSAEGFESTWVSRVGAWGEWQFERGRALHAAVFGDFQAKDWSIERWQQPLYRAKAVICLVLELSPKEPGYCLDDLDVAYWNHREFDTPDGMGGSCDELRVGHGFFENWYAHIQHESWP